MEKLRCLSHQRFCNVQMENLYGLSFRIHFVFENSSSSSSPHVTPWSSSSNKTSSLEVVELGSLADIPSILEGENILPSISDYSSMIFKFNEKMHIRAPFRYFNYWAKLPGFSKIIQKAWAADVQGTPLFREVTKLWRVKEQIIAWKKNQYPVSTKLQEARASLDDLQKRLIDDPDNTGQKLMIVSDGTF